MSKDIKIACPKCHWEPKGHEHWFCSCGHRWHTFDTAGKCPSCNLQWEYTDCLLHHGGCPSSSRHIDWYHGLGNWLETELEATQKSLKPDQ